MPSTPSGKAANDTSLRFYRDVLGLERLHYGIWKEDDELTFDALKQAQARYETYLLDNIPGSCETVLDVGCGTGEMCVNLEKRGYRVEGLSPDRNQKKAFAEKLSVPFHHSRFEDFEVGERRFDCIIMSESCQYIPVDRVFAQVDAALSEGGALLVCDYFVVDQDAGILSESGHDRSSFLEAAETAGFVVAQHRDITEEAAKTLDMGKLIADRIVLAGEILTERFRRKHRWCFGFAKWCARKKIEKMERQRPLLDAEAFSRVKRYDFFVFKRA